MITHDLLKLSIRNEEVYKLTDNLFSGGTNYGVFEAGGLVYKVYNKSELDSLYITDESQIEAKILKELESIYFPKIVMSTNDYLIMEYFEGVQLCEIIDEYGTIPKWLNEQLKEALDFIFSRSYIPNNLKPQHILVNTLKQTMMIVDVLHYQKTVVLDIDKQYYYQLLATDFNYGEFCKEKTGEPK